MPADPHIDDHQRWLGYLQPDGLVVSPAALVASGVLYDRNTRPLHQRFLDHLTEKQGWNPESEDVACVRDVRAFLTGFLEWPEQYLASKNDIPGKLQIYLPGYHENLRPTHALRHPREEGKWVLLIQEIETGADFDAQPGGDHAWQASPMRKLERLLRETQVGAGLLTNGEAFCLVYAPAGENVGALTFRIGEMSQIAGRPILGGFHQLLETYRVLTAPEDESLHGLLRKSREFQANVSTQLAGQVLGGLYALLRGLQSANARTDGNLLRQAMTEHPDSIYEALVSVLMRLVFLLFAEDRGLVPSSRLYQENYSLHGLYEQLRRDQERYPDTMDDRYGAWARLLALFRLIYSGSAHPEMQMPARTGYLFDPERFPFLEGRNERGEETAGGLPLIPDGTIFEVLGNLLLLDGERLSYRTLDVEQIGSVYETVMGFRVEVACGRMIALKPKKKHGAPVHIDLEALLATKSAERAKFLQDLTALPAAAANAVKTAETLDDLLSALEKRIDRRATPHPLPAGSILFQPTDERRRSGSHYTPRSFTEPIVRKALKPILDRLGPHPTEEQILNLKIADIAVGSAAFLVEVCRQLARALLAAWAHHRIKYLIPEDEDEERFAMRLVAQRCLYGVDRNPMAVDLAKLSLWLATMAKDHPFTFLDHSIKCGDSLVGLTRSQIAAFHWDLSQAKDALLGQEELEKDVDCVARFRTEILEMREDNPAAILKRREFLASAEEAANRMRSAGDLAVAAFFDGSAERLSRREEYLQKLLEIRKGDTSLLPWLFEAKSCGQRPFHWEIEFPEVFLRDDPGFDAIIGNPPFLGGRRIRGALGSDYFDWLGLLPEASGNADLVAHFYRRAFSLLRTTGTFGLIATNTIAQGDTRHTGLRWIRVKGEGTVYAANRRVKWPGEAAVIVSIVWIAKELRPQPALLDGKETETITAFLFHQGGDESPEPLIANARKSFQGCVVLGMGFTFDDTDTKGVASSLAEMERLIANEPRNRERIFPYLGGEEINASPIQGHHRFVVNFSDFPLRRKTVGETWQRASAPQRNEWLRTGVVPDDYPDDVAADWPDLLGIVEEKVRPERQRRKANGDYVLREPLPTRWWQFADKRPALMECLAKLDRFLAVSRHGQHFAMTFLPTKIVPAESIVAFVFESFSGFACLQSRVHDQWSRFLASSIKDDLRYTPSDCFETFPFPSAWEADASLENAGRAYYVYRAELMLRNNEGLTLTYNRFHDPSERSPEIQQLRQLHASMDRAVLDAYGWKDIATDCEFLLDYDEDEEESASARQRKKPWRYRWPDEVRDEVLARLLALNQDRAAEEQRDGTKAESKGKLQATKPQRGKASGEIL